MRLIMADSRNIPLADESVQCCVTSPPYWGLRDYGTARWEGGDSECDHSRRTSNKEAASTLESSATNSNHSREGWKGGLCGKCGAVSVDAQLGLEKTPEEYVANMVAVFREVRRVLRPDGTLWLNLGDSYNAQPGQRKTTDKVGPKQETNEGSNTTGSRSVDSLKPKDLCGIPWRVAFALQADGWWLRQDIIWAKLNPMPESVTDRCTKSHEYLFLLTKSASYFYDAEAVKEPVSDVSLKRAEYGWDCDRPSTNPSGRNRRSVWFIPTQPYSGAHFATFPEKLVKPCILAGTSERGACSKCGAPWERVVERGLTAHDGDTESAYAKSTTASRLALLRQAARERGEEYSNQARTTGWQPTCSCGADTKPCLVLDPFCGSGTVGVVAGNLGRDFVGLDISEAYLELARQRIAAVQPPLQYRGDCISGLMDTVERAGK